MSTPQASDDQLANVPPEIAALLPATTARRLRAVPIGFTSEDPPALWVAMRDPQDRAALQQLRTLAGHPIAPMAASSLQLGLALDRHYSAMSGPPAIAARPLQAPAPAPVLAPVDKEAWKRAALPDGHEEDGVLHDGSDWMGKALLSAVMSGLLYCVWFYLRTR